MDSTNIIMLLAEAVLGYFLMQTMGDLKAVIKQSSENKSDLALLKQESDFKHTRLEEKLDELKDSIVSLTDELKTYNKKN